MVTNLNALIQYAPESIIMKLLATFLLAATVSATVTPRRQSSLDALGHLQVSVPVHQRKRSSGLPGGSNSASEVLASFYNKVLDLQKDSLQTIFSVEAETLSYGDKVEEQCWKNNIPIIDGIVRWIGADYSECIRQLDLSVVDVLRSIYRRSHDDEVDLSKYSFLQAFKMKNIVSNPQSIIDAISAKKVDVTDAIPELKNVINGFEDDLNGTLPAYTECLAKRLSQRKQEIDSLKDLTEQCLAAK